MRKLTMAVLVFLFALPILAQEPPPQAILREVLNLDDGQLKSLGDLMEKRRAAVEPLAGQLGQAQQSLFTTMTSESPDSAAIGKIMLTIRDLQRQVEQRQHEFADGFLALLTDGQRAQVQQIRNVEAAMRAAQALHAIGL